MSNDEREVNPITPDEATNLKRFNIPSFVIQAFNNCIAQNFDGDSSCVMQDAVVSEIMTLGKLNNSHNIHKNNWLDVEDIYRGVGWKVEYDAPGYDESYEPRFTFTKKR